VQYALPLSLSLSLSLWRSELLYNSKKTIQLETQHESIILALTVSIIGRMKTQCTTHSFSHSLSSELREENEEMYKKNRNVSVNCQNVKVNPF
jgi:hypothetical protein